MAKIKNMGTSTMSFKEGIIVSGSTAQQDGTYSDYAFIVTGSQYIDATGGKGLTIKKEESDASFIRFVNSSDPTSWYAYIGMNSSENLYISPGRSQDFYLQMRTGVSQDPVTFPFRIHDTGKAKFEHGQTSSSDANIDLPEDVVFSVSGSLDGTRKAVFTGDVHVSGSIIVGDSYSFPATDGDADQVLTTNGSGAVSFQSISNLNVPSFIVFGENSSKANQTSLSEMKTTNGAQNGQGWRMPVAGTATHISIQFDSESYGGSSRNLVVELFKNGSSTAKTISVAVNDNGDFGGNGSITSESFSAGDRLMLKFQHSDTGLTTSKHAAILRILTSTA
jgi:hypothetical protein